MAMQSRWDRAAQEADLGDRRTAISIAADGILDDALRRAAQAQGMSKAELAREILTRWCKDRGLLPRSYVGRVGGRGAR